MIRKSVIAACLLFFVASAFSQNDAAPSLSSSEKEMIQDNISKLPVSFRKNMGQWDGQILYQGSSPGWNANVYVMKDKLSFGFCREAANNIAPKDKHHVAVPHEYLVWNIRFKNCNANAEVVAAGKEDSHTNYLMGNDESRYKTNVPDYRVIKYENIYDNVDIQYYSKGKTLEYDVMLKPYGDLTKIEMECEGVRSIDINEKGQLVINTAWGTLLEEIPESYQYVNGKKELVKISYLKINENTFGFSINGPYNNALALVVDPITYAWGTFVGGGPGADAYISDITVDRLGNVYGTGWCNTVYPVTAGSYDPTYNGGGGYGDAYIFKLNPTATSIVYATFLGGSANSSGASNAYEQGEGIAVNSAGEVYVTGWTQSTDFPTTAGSFDQTFNGTSYQDIFITKLNAAGSALVYSTYVGGIYSDYAYALELNSAGEVYITGYSTNFNLDFPTTAGAYQASALTSQGGVYILKMNAAGSGLLFSTFTGNPSGRGYGLAIDAAGAAYVTGENYGNMDSTAGAFRTIPNAMIGVYPDVFAQKISPTGGALNYSTYLGGDNWDDIYYGDGIAVDGSGNAYIFGYTSSANFPVTAGAYDVTFSGGSDPFLTKLNASGTALVYSTFVGGDGIGESVAVNAAGEAFIAGNSNSQGFTATSCAYDATHNGATDCFVGKMNASGSSALYLTYVGGTQSDYGNGPFGKVKLILTTPCEDQVYVCTTTHSTDFPTTAGTVQPVKLNSGADQPAVFHLKPTVTPNFTYAVNPCNAVNFTDASTGNCVWQSGAWTPSAWLWNFGDGGTSTSQNPIHTYLAAGTYSVKLIVSCPKDSITISVTVSSSGLVLATSSTQTTCGTSTGTATVNVTTGTGPFTYSWAPAGGSGATATGLGAGTYTVTVSNGSCSNTATATVTSTGASPVTSAISGTSPVCANSNSNYSVTNTAGSSYTWAVPAGATINSGQGTNTINVSWGTSGGTVVCTETNSCGTGTPVNLSVSITPLPVTSFSYTGSPYCQNAVNPSPTFSGGGTAGTFTSSPAGLIVNASTGIVNLSSSTTGTYSVTNTIASSGGCPAVSSISSITINPVQTAGFNYPSSTFCASGTNPSATITGTSGGTFSSSPSGLVFVSSSTGEINLASSTLNTYSLTYTSPGPCANSSSVSITITNAPVSAFSYGSSAYCQNETDPSPNFSGGGSAGIFTASPAGLTFVSASTGEIDLSGSAPGTYSVTNTIAASGGCPASSATANITINAIQNASFNYSSSNYCQAATDPTPTITGVSGGTFSSSPAGLIFISITTGQIDVSASAPNSYTITYTSPGPCPASSSAIVTITMAPNANFSYTASPYCLNGSEPVPTMGLGATPGIFTSSSSGLVVDSLDGDIELPLSTAGTYTITNTIAASGTCPAVTATATITLEPIQNSGFSYPLSTYCQAGVNPTPTMTGASGGTFSCLTPGLVFASTATGEINLSASTVNSYDVTYTSPGPCATITIQNITITSSSVATFSFTGSPYCQSAGDPSPTFSGGGSAGTFSSSVGLIINSGTGVIDLSASTPGTYAVTNTIAASGGCPAISAISSVTINALQNSAFTYPLGSYCQSGIDPTPTITGISGGSFSSTAGLTFVSTTTGEIDLSSSVVNTYAVTYTSPGPCASITVQTITISNASVATFSFTGSPYCQSASDPSPTFTGAGSAGTFSSSAGLSINSSTGIINLAASTPGTYIVTNTIAASGACSAATATSPVTITAPQTATFSYAGSPFCQTAVSPSPIFTGGSIAGVFSSTTGLSINSGSGVINLAGSTAGTYTVINTIAASGGCPAVSASTTIIISATPVIAVNAATICIGQSATLTASGASSYSWSGGGTTSSINVSPVATASYTVTGTTAGCSGMAAATVNVLAVPVAAASGNNVCSGESIHLTATGGGTYSWSGPAAFISNLQNPSIVNSSVSYNGNYVVTVSNGTCSSTSSISITVTQSPVADAGSDVIIVSGTTTQLIASGGTVFSWSPAEGLSCTTCEGPIASPTETTTYCVQVSNGTCVDSSCVKVSVETPCPSNKDLKVPNAFSPNDDGHNDQFCLKGWSNCITEFTIFIYDRWGEKVFESNDASFCWDGTYKGKKLDPAVFVYLIKASFSNNEETEKKGNISLIR